MHCPDLPTSQKLGGSLLDHDGLMTPILLAYFGSIKVEVLQTEVLNATTLRRVSRLHQAATGAVILDAEMILNTAALPRQVLIGLQDTPIPFGQLLMDAGITARSVERQIVGLGEKDKSERRLGRRHRLVNARTEQELCKIVETLSPLPVLLAAHEAFVVNGADHD